VQRVDPLLGLSGPVVRLHVATPLWITPHGSSTDDGPRRGDGRSGGRPVACHPADSSAVAPQGEHPPSALRMWRPLTRRWDHDDLVLATLAAPDLAAPRKDPLEVVVGRVVVLASDHRLGRAAVEMTELDLQVEHGRLPCAPAGPAGRPPWSHDRPARGREVRRPVRSRPASRRRRTLRPMPPDPVEPDLGPAVVADPPVRMHPVLGGRVRATRTPPVRARLASSRAARR
jgi:hypothetical protein